MRSLSEKQNLNQGVKSMQEKRIKSLKLPEPDNLVPRGTGTGHRHIWERAMQSCLLEARSWVGSRRGPGLPWEASGGAGTVRSHLRVGHWSPLPAVCSPSGQADDQDCGRRMAGHRDEGQPGTPPGGTGQRQAARAGTLASSHPAFPDKF